MHKYMIKYNNKEISQHDIQLDSSHHTTSNQILAKNLSNIRNIEKTGCNQGGSIFQSPQHKEKTHNNYSNFPQRRSKSHKINYQKTNKSKLKSEVFRKREERGNKMELLVIIPNKNQINEICNNKSSSDHTLNGYKRQDKFTSTNSIKDSNLKQEGKNWDKSNIRDDIAIGKMRLLSHKSKLSPITQKSKEKKQAKEIYKSQEKLNGVQILETTSYNKMIKDKQRCVKDHYLKKEQLKITPSLERYIQISEETNPFSIINIQSIIPNISIAERLTLQIKEKQKRRITEPNIDTTQQFYDITQQNGGTLYEKKLKQCISSFESSTHEFNFSLGKQRIKNYQDKFKSSQWKKKIFLSNLTKFIVPYQTYYYRDMLWKINYSNRRFVEPPLQYQHRLKAYVGKGNNSSMVRGLISRRYWFAITDRIEEANFIWTQLKQFRYFDIQKKNSNPPQKIKPGTYTPKSLLLNQDIRHYKRYCESNKAVEEHSDERMLSRQRFFHYSQVLKGIDIKEERLHNHFINNYIISNKKSLFRVLNLYYRHHQIDPFNVIPITFHVSKGIQDPIFLSFQRFYHNRTKQIRRGQSNRKNYWIVKPGENSNRGNGIKLCFKLSEIKQIIRQRSTWGDGSSKTYIIQSYIQNPLLYHKRKFDLRHYMMLTCVNGQIKGYWYESGYVRTTSSQYTLEFNSSNVHLTNDAIQKYLPNYGKYEKGNKLSYSDLDAYIKKKSPHHGFYSHIYPEMKKIGIDIMKASANYLDPNRLSNNFELFGLDFMIDDKFHVWLIEVNSNPCLELSCPLLSCIIPNLIQNVLELTMDAHFPPAVRYSAKIPRYLGRTEDLNKFELVFDERAQQMPIFQQNIIDDGLLQEEDDQFQDQSSEWEDNV